MLNNNVWLQGFNVFFESIKHNIVFSKHFKTQSAYCTKLSSAIVTAPSQSEVSLGLVILSCLIGRILPEPDSSN